MQSDTNLDSREGHMPVTAVLFNVFSVFLVHILSLAQSALKSINIQFTVIKTHQCSFISDGAYTIVGYPTCTCYIEPVPAIQRMNIYLKQSITCPRTLIIVTIFWSLCSDVLDLRVERSFHLMGGPRLSGAATGLGDSSVGASVVGRKTGTLGKQHQLLSYPGTWFSINAFVWSIYTLQAMLGSRSFWFQGVISHAFQNRQRTLFFYGRSEGCIFFSKIMITGGYL